MSALKTQPVLFLKSLGAFYRPSTYSISTQFKIYFWQVSQLSSEDPHYVQILRYQSSSI